MTTLQITSALAPRRCLALLVLAATTILAVSDAIAGTIRDDRDPQSYINLAASPSYASAGSFNIEAYGTEFAGSGTLVGDRWVLTAAHLLNGATGVRFNVAGKTYEASDWVQHPKWKGDYRRGNDLALVRLSAPVTDVVPARLYGGSREFGMTATFVGVGQTGTGAGGEQLTFDGVERAGQNIIDGSPGRKPKTYLSRLKKDARVFLVDFDNPRNTADNALGSPQPLDLEYLISLGDSGGGAFVDLGDGGPAALVGVHSFGEMPDGVDDSDYGDVTGHVRVSKSVNWIRSVLRKEGDPAAALRLSANVVAADAAGRSLATSYLSRDSAPLPEPTAAAAAAITLVAVLLRRPARRSLCN